MKFDNLNWESIIDSTTGPDEWYSVYTIQLGELISNGVFSWDGELLDWSEYAYSNEQYERVCAYFIERFRYREISIEPYLEWAQMLSRTIRFELCPKFNPLYEAVENGISPLADSDEYEKKREISSNYPETMLSGNSDYISTGKDSEYERIHDGNTADMMENYLAKFKGVDQAFLDELEGFFISRYTTHVNGY